MARLFFAVWPGSAAPALARLGSDLALVAQGKAVPQEKIHLTLAFLGEVGEALAGVHEAAREVAFGRFSFTLDRVGSFRAARVAWAGCAEVPQPLAALQSALAGRLRAARFRLEERPFAPHATLARRIRRPAPIAAIDPVAWRVDAFTLVRSVTGQGRYEVLEEYRAG
ncbi:MAG TPA: RNA 2',3'-cyclic phosphodiesterase [Usitatibacter sp.]|nr:RNA 2',3'-cyclic phosphodiesterase [Usitatibacter sp.]